MTALYRKYYSVSDMPQLSTERRGSDKPCKPEECRPAAQHVRENKSMLPFDLKNDDIILLIVILILLMDDCDDKLLLIALGFVFFNK